MVALAIGVAIGCTGIGTSLAVPLQGGDITESLTDGVLATALNTATGYASTQIGQARVGEIGERGGKKVLVSGGLDGFTHKLLHALNGAALGVAVSRGKDVVASAAAGAIGSVGAELLGEYLMEDVIGRGHEPAVLREKLQQRADIAKLAATTGALVTGHDPAIASSAAETAVRHNGVESHLALASLYAKKIETIISGVEAAGDALTSPVPVWQKAQEEHVAIIQNAIVDAQEKLKDPTLSEGQVYKLTKAVEGYKVALEQAKSAPTTLLGAGAEVALPVFAGAVVKAGAGLVREGAKKASSLGSRLIAGFEGGVSPAVQREAYEVSERVLEDVGKWAKGPLSRGMLEVSSLSKLAPEVSYTGSFTKPTTSSLARKEATLASRPTSTPSVPSPTTVMMEGTEFVGSKVKPPLSARDRALAYSEKLREEMKAMPKPFTSSPKPTSVASSTPPLSAAESISAVERKPIAEMRNAEFVQDIATRAERKIGGTGMVAGTKKHTYAKELGERAQRRFGERGLEFEKGYKGGKALTKGESRKGSTRLDVYDTTEEVVYDYKFVKDPGKGLRSKQVRKIQEQGPKDAKIVEVNPFRKDQ